MTPSKDSDKDLEFIYDDCDSYENEISELYTYTEETEFERNLENFEVLLKSKGYETWNDLNCDTKKSLIMHTVQVIELTDKTERLKAVTWLLYLVQGVYGECLTNDQLIHHCQENCILLYKMGVFGVVKDLLLMEIKKDCIHHKSSCKFCGRIYITQPDLCQFASKDSSATEAKRSTLFSIADCVELRSILTILYIMVETLRRNNESDTEVMQQAKKEFLSDLGQSLNDSDSLVIALFDMVVKFCSDTSSCLPMKKVLLLLWKLLLVRQAILGGFKSIHEAKNEKRIKAGLKTLDEDPLEIVRNMKASAPPASPSDILEIAQGPRRRRIRNTLYEIEASGLDSEVDGNRNDKPDSVPFDDEKVTSIDDDLMDSNPDPVDKIILDNDDEALLDQNSGVLVVGEEKLDKEEYQPPTPAPGAMTPIPGASSANPPGGTASIAAKLIKLRKQQQEAEDASSLPSVKVVSGLPWIPKAREKDVEVFLNLVRQKFIGFSLSGDLTTEAGLPNPTKDSIAVLRKHLYTPLADIEVAREAEIAKFPLTIGKTEVVPDTLTERLYQSLLPNLPQYMIALLKILLAAAPTSKAKNDSINVLSDVLPQVMPTGHVASLKVGIDVNRHREIIVKSISAIILLLLKHFKLSHTYQFEYASQHLVFANCIPLVLKFFNHNIVAYVTTKNAIPCLEFPGCVLGDKSELTAESLESLDASTAPCWRNLFSCINLLRILNNLVKLKHSRTMMLVVFKSSPILKRALKVRQAMFQLYVLKLLKIQTKYLGRQWRKSNMKIMSAIYQKVRHRLNDDWAYGNDVDARPWDFQQEECALRTSVERFNLRRYHMTGSRAGETPNVSSPIEDDYEPVDNNIQNLLREEIDLPSDFRKSYDVWLEREVFSSSIDWDQLLSIPCVQ